MERWFGSGDTGDEGIDESDGDDMLEDEERLGELSESSNDDSVVEDAELIGLKLRVWMSGASYARTFVLERSSTGSDIWLRSMYFLTLVERFGVFTVKGSSFLIRLVKALARDMLAL